MTATCTPTGRHIHTNTRGPLLSKFLYKIVQSLKFGEDCKIVTKIVTLLKQLLYITHDVTCDHMICSPFVTLICKIYSGIFEITQKFTEK